MNPGEDLLFAEAGCESSPMRGLLLVCACGLLVGCRDGGTPTATERLWVTALPKSPKTTISAFFTTKGPRGRYVGAFFKGSMYRGGHDVFEWTVDGTDTARLRFMQDGSVRKIRLEPCKPSVGFDYCMLVHGDPTGAKRYQSRKRWALRRGAQDVRSALAQLADEDPELRDAIEP